MKESKYFKESELMCKCGCGKTDMDPMFMEMLDMLREELDRPVVLTSAYRCSNHPVEAGKERPGMHSEGKAADIKVSNGSERYRVLDAAYKLGFTGVGVANGFIHLDTRKGTPVVWRYS